MEVKIFLILIIIIVSNHVYSSEKIKNKPDLIFNCNLVGKKRILILNQEKKILIDQADTLTATFKNNKIIATKSKKWSENSLVHYRIVLDKFNGKLEYIVFEQNILNKKREYHVVENGQCSKGKIHPKHL